MNAVRYECDDEGIATIWFDDPARSVNLLDEASVAAFEDALGEAIADTNVFGVIIASAKRQFVAGADLARIFERAEALDGPSSFGALLRRLETSGKPFVAVLAGDALGGGAELALAAHRRIGIDDASVTLGFPEVTLGLMPGAGGTQRLPRTIGIAAALPILLEGRRLTFPEARRLGIIDELVPPEHLYDAARAWIRSRPDPIAPWDRRGFAVPGGEVQSIAMRTLFQNAIVRVRKRTWGVYPAPPAILAAVYEGAQLQIDAGLRVERRHFRALARTPEAHAMVRTMFFSLKRANALAARPRGVERTEFRTVAVLGAGMMGSGIARVAADAGMRVVLIDRDRETAERGKKHPSIVATETYELLADATIAIEAVFEDRSVKAEVTRRAEAALPADAIVASNTSTLPIASLAGAMQRRADFIGMHFFSPVDRMRLVEIIRGTETGDRALAVALDFARALGKTPIVVRDRRGFFTSRVFKAYTREGLMLLADGVAPALIENAGRLAGMAVGPLAVQDEVSMTLACRIIDQMRADDGDAYVAGPGDEIFELFVRRLDRPGKHAGRGFYEYPPNGRKSLWAGLHEHFPLAPAQPEVDEVKRRLLYAQSLEAARAFDEGVIDDPGAGDLASILGWGFPAATGGVFSLIDRIGAERFVRECDAFAQRFGARFLPPEVLRRFAREDATFAHPPDAVIA